MISEMLNELSYAVICKFQTFNMRVGNHCTDIHETTINLVTTSNLTGAVSTNRASTQ